ncbi:MAG: efflux RND transporter periplasmic adaptor subunit [Ginsengibacter sp.]
MKFLKIFIFSFVTLTGCQNKKEAPLDPDIFYTCSMHPQIIRDKPGKCPICQMELISVNRKKVTATDEIELSNEQIMLGNIQTDTIKGGEMESQTVLPATISFNERNITTISARLPGRIEKLYFRNIGDYVSKGAAVYSLYSEELNNAQQQYVLLLQQRKELGNSVINFNQLLESARTKLVLWGMSQGEVREIERTHKTRLEITFYSNASGFITSLDILEGDYAMGGQALMKLADVSKVWVEAQVYTSLLSQLDKNGQVMVQIPELGKEVKGKIDFVNPEVNPQSRINLLRVNIPNPGNQLKPGMSAYIFLKGTNVNSISISSDAIIKNKNMSMIWLKTGINKFRSQMVTTGSDNNGITEITNGLKNGDVIVVSGAYLLNSEYMLRNGSNSMQGMPGGNMGNMKM